MERRYGVDFRPKVSPELVGPTKSAWPTYCDHLFTKGGPKSQYGRSGKRTKRKIRPTPSDPYEAPTRTKCSTAEPHMVALSSSFASLRGVSPFENSSSSVSGVDDDLQSERSFYVSFDVDEESGFGSLPGTPEIPETERTSCSEEDQISFTTQDTTISDYCVSETSEDKDSVTGDHRLETWEDVITKPNQEKPATDVFIPCAEITADIPEKRESEASGPWRPYGPPGIPEILRRKEEKKKTEEDMRRLRKLILILTSLSALALALAVSIVMGHFLRPEEPLPEWMALFSFPGKSESFPHLRGDLLAIVAARRPPPIPPIISDCFNVSLPLSENGDFICSDVTYGPRLGQKYIVTFCVLSCDAGYHGEDAGLLFCDNSTWSPIAPEVLSALVGLGQAVDAVPRTESFAANLTQLNVNGTVYTKVTAGVMSRLDLADEVSLGSLEDSLSYFEYPGNGTIGDPYVLRQALSHTSPRLVGEVSGMNFTAALAQLDAFGASKNPTCKKVDCGDPRNPDNGSIFISGRTEFGDVLEVRCDPGYEKSHPEIECLENGNWTEVTCDAVDCGQPQNVSDGVHICQGTTFTQTCDVTCDVGYVPVTSDKLVCSSIQKWMRMPEGTNITILMKEYIEPNVSEVLSCEKMACGNITVPDQGEVMCSGTRYNDTCELSCAEGYIPTAGTQFTCDAAGNWTDVPECAAVECGDPPSFPNTVFECSTGTSFPHGCSASCETGYRNTNYTHVTCGSHGNWTLGSDTDVSLEGLADDFFCERKDCGALEEPNNGSLVCTGTRFEDTCQLTCDTGYEVTQDDGIILFDKEGYTCTEAGTWSSQPTCGESDFCLHGHDDCDLQYGVCEHTGHRNYSCRCTQGTLGDGTSCAPPICGVLNATEPANGKLTCELQSSASSPDCRDGSVSGVDHQEYESVCSLVCNPGYKQTLDVSYMCLKNGDWHTPMDIGNGNVQPCVDIDECLSSPCRNNATCTNLENSYSCACVPGFTGTDCDVEINECQSDPCLNGGYCSDDVDSYTCSCLDGWTDVICQTDIDECSSSPCQHDGTCEDRVNGYTCHCTEGWEGEDCEINIDDCAGVTCQHGGRCDDHVSSYSCNCTGGWIGEHCESRAPSCAVLKDSGYTNSGIYVIDPDGPDTGMEPFSVHCDLDTGSTSVGHDSEGRTRVSPGCEAAGCYRREVKYNATLDQLSALVAVSNSCKQLFKYECYNSILGIAWWNSRTGQKQVNWAGSEADGGRRCSCGISGTCADDSPTCNCDNNDNIWREDSGWLTDKNSLPVMQLNFGDTGDAGEDAFHTLGRFTCEGTKQ